VGVVDEDVVDVVLEDCGLTGSEGVSMLLRSRTARVACLLYCREVASGEDVQQRCFAASTVTSVTRVSARLGPNMYRMSSEMRVIVYSQ